MVIFGFLDIKFFSMLVVFCFKKYFVLKIYGVLWLIELYYIINLKLILFKNVFY